MKKPIHVTAGFFLVSLWFAAVNGWKLFGVILLFSLVHELGHYIILNWYRAEITGFQLSAFGAVIEANTSNLSYGEEFLAVAAGPAANFLCASLLALGQRQEWEVLVGCNIILCVFNLLPLRLLDGGRMWYLVTSWLAGPQLAEKILRWSSVLAAALISAVLIGIIWSTRGSFWLIPPIVGFLLTICREIKEN